MLFSFVLEYSSTGVTQIERAGRTEHLRTVTLLLWPCDRYRCARDQPAANGIREVDTSMGGRSVAEPAARACIAHME